MTRFVVPLAAVLFAAAQCRADMGPFPPGTTFADPVHRVEVADVPAGFVGVLAERYGPPTLARESRFIELTPGVTFEWSGRYHDVAELMIVPRAVLDRYPRAEDVAEAVERGAVSAVRQQFRARETVPRWTASPVVFAYRVRAAGDGIEVVRTSRDPMWQWTCAALAPAAALALGGLWLVRRLFRRRGPNPPV